jgi:hypothetical protein
MGDAGGSWFSGRIDGLWGGEVGGMQREESAEVNIALMFYFEKDRIGKSPQRGRPEIHLLGDRQSPPPRW